MPVAHCNCVIILFNVRYNFVFLNGEIYFDFICIGGKLGYRSETSNQKTEEDTRLYMLPDFVSAAEIDNINIYRLLVFCKNSKIAHKVSGC